MSENQRPGISIITVCYEEPAEAVDLTFANIASQSYENVEWIVIDGGSSAETVEAITRYLDRVHKYISEPDDGIYDAMNKGLSIASGDFVIFMNVGDRFYCSETVEQIVDCILASPTYDCYYGDVIVMDDGKEYAVPQPRRVSRYVLSYSMVCHQSIVARRSIYDTAGSFDTDYRILADRDWALRSVRAGAKWLFLDMFICYYDRNGVSSDSAKSRVESARYVARNFGPLESFVCFFLRKHRNIKQRLLKAFRCQYKGMPRLTGIRVF